ncbi:MAG: HAMP domain-containing protein [Gammaproteobacteria bacterium]|nr:HAMP domain-containing protein [Gammaproteobacteria bacterium]
MNLLPNVIGAVKGTLRYKLLVLVLFPILLIMPIALIIAIYWGNNLAYQQLFIKVNTDLSVSNDIFKRIREDYLNKLNQLAGSYAFRIALEAKSDKSVLSEVEQLRSNAGFTYLHIVDKNGDVLGSSEKQARSSAALLAAFRGKARVGIEIFNQKELEAISQQLSAEVKLPLIDTPRARPTARTVEDRAMMIRALLPIVNTTGEVEAILDGGVMLNGNFTFVDLIRDLVYGEGSLIDGSIGTVTVFLEDVRITTNVPLRPGERALGTRVSNEVRAQVLDRGENWVDRAFVVNDWYISAYEPIVDINGNRVGMLYAGFLEAPFRKELRQALAVLIGFFIALMLLSAIIAVLGAKSIFKPLELMSAVVHATRDGRDVRVGKISSRDEIGVLAHEFDAMLELLKERNQQIQNWAVQLEDKVEERTSELLQRNDELQRTIHVLQETRRQLVIAEKLAALGELTAGVAHEINNPTAVILGNLDVLVEELGSAVDPVRNEIDLIIDQIYRIKDIINNLLQYSRPEEYAGYLSSADINEIVEQTLALVRHLQKQDQFKIELDLKSKRMIQINQQEIKQVLVNLVVNAVHSFQNGNGTVRLETEDWDNKGVVIRIQDNGTGMNEEQLDRIFNPFYSTKDQGKGTGLGLSVSYSMIRRYGGEITVESKPGEGSRFTVWLLAEPELVNDEEMISEQLHSVNIQ